MKKKVLTFMLVFMSIIGYAQVGDIGSSWIWRDSKNTVSLFIRKDGTISKSTSLISDPMNASEKNGKYIFKNKQILIITWDDKSVEKNKIKFIEKNAIEVSLLDKQGKPGKKKMFLRVMDEEVVPE